MKGAIVAIDPGTTTGIAWVQEAMHIENVHVAVKSEGKHGAMGEVVARIGDGGELLAAGALMDLLHAIEAVHGLAVVVYESFTLRQFNMGKNLLAPVRMMAYIQAIADEREVGMKATWIPQNPSAMGVWTRPRLERLHLWLPGEPHARDALRHLLTRLQRL